MLDNAGFNGLLPAESLQHSQPSVRHRLRQRWAVEGWAVEGTHQPAHAIQTDSLTVAGTVSHGPPSQALCVGVVKPYAPGHTPSTFRARCPQA